MFRIAKDESGTVFLTGRLDAAACSEARDFMADIQDSCRIDFSGLDYIASAGLGLLVAIQRRLMDRQAGLCLCGLSPHLKDVMSLAGFEGIFEFD
jgi:anti-anti-sigma factor